MALSEAISRISASRSLDWRSNEGHDVGRYDRALLFGVAALVFVTVCPTPFYECIRWGASHAGADVVHPTRLRGGHPPGVATSRAEPRKVAQRQLVPTMKEPAPSARVELFTNEAAVRFGSF